MGKPPSTQEMRDHVDKVLKKQPAVVVGLAECQLETELVLRRDPAAVAVAPNAQAKRTYKYRPELSYLTLRGKEESSVLIAVRDQAGCALELLDTDRPLHGQLKRKKRQRQQGKIRCILSQHVGLLGK